jgi:pyridoxamine 5'-phosphate oxidase
MRPSTRVVLIKGYDERGIVWYTNYDSRKGKELAGNPYAALQCHWVELERVVRIEGRMEKISDAESDAYFHSRPHISRVGAWASKQSQPLAGRFELEARVAKFTALYPASVPRPPFWSGFRVEPAAIELWEDRPFRLHMRYRYEKSGDGWSVGELYP